MLFAALRESSHATSMRPLGATESVPKMCHLLGLTGSSLILCGALKVIPPSVLRANITSVPLLALNGSTLAST